MPARFGPNGKTAGTCAIPPTGRARDVPQGLRKSSGFPYIGSRILSLSGLALMFNANFLFASLVWGSIGVGYFIYGKKQSSWPAMVGGVVMIAGSYFIGSALLMSLVSIAVMAAVYILLKQGH
jgi:4-hydroxybenzoate polyprenyltransferase